MLTALHFKTLKKNDAWQSAGKPTLSANLHFSFWNNCNAFSTKGAFSSGTIVICPLAVVPLAEPNASGGLATDFAHWFSAMKSHVVRVVCNYLKIFNGVVLFVSIFVMNHFGRAEVTSQVMFHNEAMSQHHPSLGAKWMVWTIDPQITVALIEKLSVWMIGFERNALHVGMRKMMHKIHSFFNSKWAFLKENRPTRGLSVKTSKL